MNNGTVHELKILPEYFEAVCRGTKKFEIRKNDRNFHAGDMLCLKEWNGKEYTGAIVEVLVTYLLTDADWYGIQPGWCVMSIELVDEK